MRKHWSSKFNWNEISMDGLRNIELGNIVQDWMDAKMMGVYDNIVKVERPVTIPLFVLTEKPIFLTGRIDHAFTPTDEENFRFIYPIEAKYLVNKSAEDLTEVEKNYLFQIQTYMASVGAEKGKIYFIDHNLKAKTFTLKLDFELIQEGIDRITALHDWVEEKQQPPAEALYSSERWLRGQCYYCPIRRDCYKKEKKEID